MRKNILFLFLCVSVFSYSQIKFEYEERIPISEFPEKATALLRPKFNQVRRLRFYKEFDGEHKSFESKFKYNGKHYSVEFNRNGQLEDVEVKLGKREFEKETLKNIENFLDEKYQRWKIEKIQEKYETGESAEKILEAAFTLKKNPSNNFEIIIATKTEGKLEKFEMIFSNNGTFIEKRKILRRSYDFLLF